MDLQSKRSAVTASRPKPMTGLYTNGLHCKVTKKFLAAQIINAYLCKHIFVEGVAELNFPRLKTAATMRWSPDNQLCSSRGFQPRSAKIEFCNTL